MVFLNNFKNQFLTKKAVNTIQGSSPISKYQYVPATSFPQKKTAHKTPGFSIRSRLCAVAQTRFIGYQIPHCCPFTPTSNIVVPRLLGKFTYLQLTLFVR